MIAAWPSQHGEREVDGIYGPKRKSLEHMKDEGQAWDSDQASSPLPFSAADSMKQRVC